MHRRLRSTLVLASLTLALTGGTALAGTDPSPSNGPDQATDPSGDSSGLDGTSDILSAGASTLGTATVTHTTTYTSHTVTKYKTVTVTKKVRGKKKKVKQKVAYKTTTQTAVDTVVKSFAPETLRLSMTLAASPTGATPGQYYTFLIHSAACGTGSNDRMFVQWFAGDKTGVVNTANCSGAAKAITSTSFPVTVDGATLDFDIPLTDASPLGIGFGDTISAINACTSQTDPLDLTPVQEVALYDETDTAFDYTVA